MSTRQRAAQRSAIAPDTLDAVHYRQPERAEAPPVPLYEQVKRQISELILLGHWSPGTVLPGETHLADEFGMSVGTVRRALADLTAEGLLMRRRRTGTVVTGRTPHHSLRFFYQYFRLHGDDGALLRSKPEVLSLMRAPAGPADAERLEIAAGLDVVTIHRVRRVDGRPVMHERMVLEARRIPDLRAASDVPDLLYRFLLERYGVRISAVRESLTAVLATAEDAAILRVAPPAAILAIDEVAYDQAGLPVVAASHRAITDRYCYMNEVR